MYNPILFVIDSNGDIIKKSGIVRAINGYREYAVIISPLSAALSMSIMTDNATFDKKEQYVLPTSHKVRDFVSEEDGLFQDIYDWNVYAVEVKEVALESIALFRTGRTTFSFQFQRIKASDKCVSFKGYFGVDSPLPVTAEIGDYYECEDYQYAIVSGDHNYAFTKGMFVYFNGTRWVKDRLLVELNTPTVEAAVEPSHATGYQLDDDDVNYLLPLGNDIIEALEKSNLALQKIEDIKSGIEPLGELSVQDELGNRMSITYDGKDPIISFRGIKSKLFKNLYIEVESASGVTFTNGMQIMYAGSIGGSGKRLAKPTNLVELKANPNLYLGTITQVTEDNHGIANWFGVVNGLDTSGSTLGAPVYAGDNGSWTLVKPTSPLPIIRVGLIERVNNSQGQISVRPNVGNYLNQLHDVYTNGHTFVGGETIMFNLSNGRYEVYNLAGKLLQVDQEIQDIKDSKVDKILTIIGLDLKNNISLEEFKVALGNVTQIVSGLMSSEDKVHLDNIVALFNEDGDDVVNTIAEILSVFQNFPEGATILEVLATKVDKVSGKQLSTNDLTNTLKTYYDIAHVHSQILNSNPHQTTYAQLLDKPVTIEQLGVLNVYNKDYIDALKDKNGWESELLGTLSNNGTIALSVINQFDEIQMYAKDTLGVIDNENIRPSLMQNGDSVYFFDDTQAFIMVDTVFGFYAPVGYTLQVVGLKYTELVASDVATDEVGVSVQDKLDEIEQKTDKLESRQVGETTIQRNSDGLVIEVTNPTVISTPLYVDGKLVSLNETYSDGKSYVTTFNRLPDGTLVSINKQEVL